VILEIAHGLVVKSDLPIPEWLFGWAAAMVLIVSFVALAALWPEPRLQMEGWRPLPRGIGRVIASRPVEILCGAIGAFLLGFVVYCGLEGTQSVAANFTPTFIYVMFWLGLVPAMALYGVEAWIERGEAFSVYFNLFSRLSFFEARDGDVGIRRPMSGLPALLAAPGTIPVLCVMIGSVTFDGLAEAPLWNNLTPDIQSFFENLGMSAQRALEATFAVGLIGAVLLIGILYRLGIEGARSVGGGFTASRLGATFIHTLVPIALAYVAAHYLTLLLIQGQAAFVLASDPLGDGSDIFGTAGHVINYTVIGATATWYWQVGFVVAGHVAALTLAHDRAITIYDQPRLAVRSQYWMLLVMVLFTSLALWLLSQANT
jgi:hypothetical protein